MDVYRNSYAIANGNLRKGDYLEEQISDTGNGMPMVRRVRNKKKAIGFVLIGNGHGRIVRYVKNEMLPIWKKKQKRS